MALPNALLSTLVDVVNKEGASDLHLAEGRTPFIRVSGFLIPLAKMAVLTKEDMQSFLDVFLSAENKKEFQTSQEANFAYQSPTGGRFRGNAFEAVGKITIALRLIPQKVKTFAELNLPPILEIFSR